MNAVIYARYSSERQTEQSIEGQMRICKEYAESNGYTIVGEYIDRAMSGKTSKRPGFLKMIRDAEENLFDTVIVYKLDRFARNRYDSIVYKQRLTDYGVKVKSAMEKISDGAEGMLLEGILETMAELYSHDLSQKVRRGRKESFLKKQFLGGYLLYGYKVVDKKIHIDEEQAKAVKYLFENYAKGMMKKEIADNLNKMGYRRRNGKLFYRKSFEAMLRNEKYIGINRVKDKVCYETYPAIIDKELFKKIQDRIKTNSERHNSTSKTHYLLSKKLYCYKCGARMTGVSGTSRDGSKHHYYGCVNKRSKAKSCDKCNESRSIIDNIVFYFTRANIVNSKFINDMANMIYENNQNGKTNEMLRYFEDNIKSIEKELKKIVGLFVKASDNDALLKDLNQRHKELTIQKEDYKKQLTEFRVSSERNKTKTKEEIFDSINEMYYTPKASLEDKKRFVNDYVNSVFVSDKELIIYFHFDPATKAVTYEEMKDSLSGKKKIVNELIYDREKEGYDNPDGIATNLLLKAVLKDDFVIDSKQHKKANVRSKEKLSYQKKLPSGRFFYLNNS